jgi:phosphate starvation-inducible protein PhoH and related proteins
MDVQNGNKKKGKKGGNKKAMRREMDEDLYYYKQDNNTDIDLFTNNKSYQYYSDKEKNTINQKFSDPRNYSQKKLLGFLQNPNYKIIIASGPAGTGKTLFSIEQGIKKYMEGKVEKLILTRPSVSVDENLGFLPGTLEEKMMPWMRPIYDIFHNFISPKEIEKLIEEKIIEICPLGFMRGRTFKNSWIVADEMQNSTISQMKMLLTRIGENTKLVITGDLEQNDLKDKNGLEDFLDKMKGKRSSSINSVEFNNEDIEREDVVKEVLELYQTNSHPYLNIDLNETSVNESLGELKKSISNNDLKSENSDVSILSEVSQENNEIPETNEV